MKHFKITFKPEGRQVVIHKGASVLEAAGQAGIILNSICGGRGTCGKCRVRLEPAGQEVLACQYFIEEELTVTILPESNFYNQKILESGIEPADKGYYTTFNKYLRFARSEQIFGVALDIGTTTVVAKLIKLQDGQVLAVASAMNPQSQFGSDVISRISAAENKENALGMQKSIISCINNLIEEMCSRASISAEQIYELCAVGNTTMGHILLGFPLTQLGEAPYKAHRLEACDVNPARLGIKINPNGNVHTVENIAGFVGSDTTAGALAAGIDSVNKMTLLVDIGTNGEIVIGTREDLFAASCAAGPALEGAGITCGSRAAEGAIEAVIADGDDIDFDVIGNGQPRSICGSGIIDAVAVMLDLGVIDISGRFAELKFLRGKIPDTIFSRLIKINDMPAFSLSKKVYLTQSDIRQVQLAKAAIRAGIILLQKEMSIFDSEIEQILLAGAFGNYIRRESAIRIGLLPRVSPERINFIGNAAASGAQMILLSDEFRQRAKALASQINYVEIGQKPDFANIFPQCLIFPEA